MTVARLMDARKRRERADTPCDGSPAPAMGDVAGRLQQLDCDPIAGLVKLARDQATTAALRTRIFTELATYIAPRRKSEALSGDCGSLTSENKSDLDLSRLSNEELQTFIALFRKTKGE